jgi:hypothetical protein
MAQQVNRYGLDFLRREHVLDEIGSTSRDNDPSRNSIFSETEIDADRVNSSSIDTEALAASVANKPDLEKQFDVIHFLQAHRSAGWMPPSVIYQRTGIDLEEETNIKVAQMLQRNPKIKVETVPDPENPSLTIDTYAYQAKYNHVRDRKTLLAQINRCKNGVPMRDMIDSYDTVMGDLDALICAGDVLALYNTEDKDKVLFPRGEPFFVELDGIINPPAEKKKQTNQPPDDDATNNTVEKAEATATVTTQEDAKPKTEVGESNNSINNVNSSNDNDNDNDIDNSNSNNDNNDNDKTPDNASPLRDEKKTAEGPTPVPSPSGTTSAMPPPPLPKSPPRPAYCVETDSDPTTQVRRGEAIQIGGTWFRVSSAVKEGPLKDQPARATAPLSVVSRKDLSKRNEIDGYIRPFTEKILPADAAFPPSAIENLQKAKEARERLLKLAHGGRAGGAASQLLGTNAHASNPVALASSLGTSHAAGSRRRPGKLHHGSGIGGGATSNARSRAAGQEAMAKLKEAALDPYLSLYSHARRHGCTKDVREMYLKTRSKVPQSDVDLKAALVEHKLLDPGEEMRRARLQKRANVDNDGKPKKRRYYERKNQRMTNTHLEGTEIGAVLRRATEKQQQGQQVGDGGM